MVTEILDTRDVDLVDSYTDIFQVGTRNMQNLLCSRPWEKEQARGFETWYVSNHR